MNRIRYGIIFLVLITVPIIALSIPEKIISLGPRITLNIYLLKADDQLIANTTYCKFPVQAEKKEKIGSVVKMDMERVLKIQPDLVLATSMANPKQLKKLQSLGVRTYTFQQPKSYKEMCDQFLKLGKMIGKKREAEKIIKKSRSKINKIIQNKSKDKKLKVFIQIGANPLFTVNNESYINDFIIFAGGINIAEDSSTGIYSREQVLKLNPDVIIITSMGIEGEKEKEIWKNFKSIDAVKNNHIYVINEYKLCSPSVVSFTETLIEIKEIFSRVKK